MNGSPEDYFDISEKSEDGPEEKKEEDDYKEGAASDMQMIKLYEEAIRRPSFDESVTEGYEKFCKLVQLIVKNQPDHD
jgi:hypothetical protein